MVDDEPLINDKCYENLFSNGIFTKSEQYTLFSSMPTGAFENIFRREYTIKGFWNSYSVPFPGREWTYSIELIEQGKVNLKDLISHRYGLDEIQKAFNMTVNKEEPYHKVMIFPQKSTY